MNKSILKAQFNSDYSAVKAILNSHDIIGFMPDLPVDEYDCINQGLLSLLSQDNDLDSIRDFLVSEIKEHFELTNNHDFIDRLAGDIYDWWNKRRKIKKRHNNAYILLGVESLISNELH